MLDCILLLFIQMVGLLIRNLHSFLVVRFLVVMVTADATNSGKELDFGHWNYRGANSVNLASVCSFTKVLNAICCIPNTNIRPLSETISDLFREVSMLHQRITELSHCLATMGPFFRHHGYHEVGFRDNLFFGKPDR
ncbi:uncharacterized protein LOC144197720 [Stigmatopora nigra]